MERHQGGQGEGDRETRRECKRKDRTAHTQNRRDIYRERREKQGHV